MAELTPQHLRELADGLANQNHEAERVARLMGASFEVLQSLEAVGVMPDGFCFCFGGHRDPLKPEHEHTGECQAARKALVAARIEHEGVHRAARQHAPEGKNDG